jgi:hypothetical protein
MTAGVECGAHAGERRVGLIAPRVNHALKADDQWIVGQLRASDRQAVLGQIQVAHEQRRLRVKIERIRGARSFA